VYVTPANCHATTLTTPCSEAGLSKPVIGPWVDDRHQPLNIIGLHVDHGLAHRAASLYLLQEASAAASVLQLRKAPLSLPVRSDRSTALLAAAHGFVGGPGGKTRTAAASANEAQARASELCCRTVRLRRTGGR
jgi:hypothetical protein